MKKLIIILTIAVFILIGIIIGAYFLGGDKQSNQSSEGELSKQQISNTSDNSNNLSETIPEDNSCKNLGCPENTKYVGSVNSDKYYTCDCHYADRILPENIVCFISDEEAVDNGYIKLDC